MGTKLKKYLEREMTLKTSQLRDAIVFALCVTASSVAFAQDATPQDPAPAAQSSDEATTLDRVEVTGSRIRRVDAENASPVVMISREAIEQTGKVTLGDLVQELPNMAGAPTNPQVNNGGGTGAAAIDLRGFGSQRTLMLINGRRAVNNDVNAIPSSAVERIEVLTSGASSVYGSDAVAGVVNFIMRRDFEGLEASVDYGISANGDGERNGGSITFGQVSDKGNIIAGLNYNRFDGISSADREFSKDATYLYSGAVTVFGSSRNPRGFIALPAGSPLRARYGCNSVTRVPGAAGTTLDEYRCYSGAADSYNYQSANLVMTPQERTNGFFLANYQVTDDIRAFTEVYHNKTSSNFAIAALPFDARSDAVTISADSYYNPFGITFGPDAVGNVVDFRSRFTSLGQRMSYYNTSTSQIVAGLEGFFADTWKWDFALNYGHSDRNNQSYGYVYYAGLADAMGPSFRDTDGVVKCGAPGAVIANCTPLNIFNIDDPATIATLQSYEARPMYQQVYIQRGFEANMSGEIFQMPAGAAQLAFGAVRRRDYKRSEVDFIAKANDTGTCFISQEACGSGLTGAFSVKELYAELFLPILSDMPFAQALNVNFGTRYSDYSNFGETTNSKLQVEWRPLDGLLFRGTAAEVFRAPTIDDLYTGPSGNAPQASDPCVGYGATGTPRNHEAACGAPTGATDIPATGIESTGLAQTTGVVSGSVYAGYALTPEEGKSFDWGMVYDPEFLPGVSINLDFWRLYLNDTITTIQAQNVLDICYADGSSPFCGFINRGRDGQINYIEQPTVNLGRLDAKGWDMGLRYRLTDTPFGAWQVGLDGTYIAQWDNDTDPTSDNDFVKHIAGQYDKAYGNYARVRSRAFVNWSKGDFSASWRTRYVGGFKIGSDDLRAGTSADAGCQYDPQYCYEVPYGSYVSHSINAGLKVAGHARVELGIDNLLDKQPPIMYQNNVLNANTDVNTYDTVGRYYWARYSVKF